MSTRPMRGLSIADQQMVEIARALASDSRLIIMDEPTAPLTPKEVATLFSIARRLRDEGRTLIFISHRLEEVRALCDRVTIFRDGRKIATERIDALDDAEIIRLMIGRPLKEYMHKSGSTIGDVALKVTNLSAPGLFRDISFEVRKGEIVGLGGLVGAGRTDVARALFGVAPAKAVPSRSPASPRRSQVRPMRSALGVAFVPEDRAQAGIFRTLPVEQNITAAIPRRIAPHALHPPRAGARPGGESVAGLRIRLATLRQPIGELSGGNQQKAILARWLLTDPSILILDEPTRGIDIGVKAEFYDQIGALAADGRAILLISSENAGIAGAVRPRAGDVGRPAHGEPAARRRDAGDHHARRRAARSRTGRGMNTLSSDTAAPRGRHRRDDRAVLPRGRIAASRIF